VRADLFPTLREKDKRVSLPCHYPVRAVAVVDHLSARFLQACGLPGFSRSRLCWESYLDIQRVEGLGHDGLSIETSTTCTRIIPWEKRARGYDAAFHIPRVRCLYAMTTSLSRERLLDNPLIAFVLHLQREAPSLHQSSYCSNRLSLQSHTSGYCRCCTASVSNCSCPFGTATISCCMLPP